MSQQHQVRLMLRSLESMANGDAFGETMINEANDVGLAKAEQKAAFNKMLQDRTVPESYKKEPWIWTDDTAMAIGVVEMLLRFGTIAGTPEQRSETYGTPLPWFCEKPHDHTVPNQQLTLARLFGKNATSLGPRGYTYAMNSMLLAMADSNPSADGEEDPMVACGWQRLSQGLFGGKGSFGNGAAMRIAPLGVYFGSELSIGGEPLSQSAIERLVKEASAASEVTHWHTVGVAGGVALALAAAFIAAQFTDAALIGSYPKSTVGMDARLINFTIKALKTHEPVFSKHQPTTGVASDDSSDAPSLPDGDMTLFYSALESLVAPSAFKYCYECASLRSAFFAEAAQDPIPFEASRVTEAAERYCPGNKASVFDTVPFTLWLIATALEGRMPLADTLWMGAIGCGLTGDTDTVLAMAAGALAPCFADEELCTFAAYREPLLVAQFREVPGYSQNQSDDSDSDAPALSAQSLVVLPKLSYGAFYELPWPLGPPREGKGLHPLLGLAPTVKY